MRRPLAPAPDVEAPFIASAAEVGPVDEPPPPPPLRCADARRALVPALLGVVCFGFVLGPIAVAMGQRARFAIAERPELEGARAADAAIALGRVGFALHLAVTMAALPWLMFVMPLAG